MAFTDLRQILVSIRVDVEGEHGASGGGVPVELHIDLRVVVLCVGLCHCIHKVPCEDDPPAVAVVQLDVHREHTREVVLLRHHAWPVASHTPP